VGTAAEYYFGKPVDQLALPEAAMLAGLISSPETYSPVNDEAAAVTRRNVVIARMAELGMVTPEEAAASQAAPLGLHITEVGNREARFPFFIQYVKSQILNDPRFGRTKRARIKTLFQGGLRIYTTLDPKLQRTGEAIIRSRFRQPGPESAVAAVDPRSGAVLSIVGGTNFRQSQVNVATGQGGTGRQSGSAFKPFTLVAAFEQGIPLGKVYDSRSGQFVNCTPYGPPRYKAVNAEGSGGGYVDLREATARSINAVFVQLAIDVGPPEIVEAAQRMGIVSPLTPFCSITLGTNEVTPLEMASAFGTLANRGVHCEPFAIRRVVGPGGGRLLKQRSGDCEQAVSRDIADRVAGLLRLVIESGTGTAANLGQWPAFGKTGTTNDSADVWFSGCTRQVCAATWVGHEEARIPMPGAYGGTVAAPVWQDFMLVAMRGNPAQGLPPIPEPEQARVPDVVGETKAAAVDILVKAHFTPQVEVVPHAPPADVVVNQEPAGGVATVAGSRVTIRVSSGVVPMRTVPDVVGRREASAVARLQEAGFVVQVSREPSTDPAIIGRVGSQTPGPGTRLPKGSTVAILVYYAAEAPPPEAPPPEAPPPEPEES
jgi:membrane peptidoglycan carboxypeptidase